MDRREYLIAAGAAGAAATAGCLTGLFDSSPEHVTLSEPDDQLTDSEHLAYPAYGEEFPAFSLPAATSDVTIDTGDLDRIAVVTTFFASCPAECGILLNQLAGVQGLTVDRSVADAVYFFPITFDPERDDADLLTDNAEMVGVDRDVDNWHYLRPETPGEAEDVITGELGVKFERTDESDRMDEYDFNHIVVTWLTNPDGITERAYRGEQLDRQRIIDDIETLADEYGLPDG